VEIKTWGDVLLYLQSCSPEQLLKPPQVILPGSDLGTLIDINTIGFYFTEHTRSTYDNKHHPEDIVFLSDTNMFAKDGAIAQDLLTGERIYPK
jgi:hypothetical protein